MSFARSNIIKRLGHYDRFQVQLYVTRPWLNDAIRLDKNNKFPTFYNNCFRC